MPHIVQPYIRQAVPFQKTLKLPGQSIRRIGLPVGPAEDEGPGCLLPVCRQDLHQLVSQVDIPDAGAGLRRFLDNLATRIDPIQMDMDNPFIQVDIRPPEGRHPAHTGQPLYGTGFHWQDIEPCWSYPAEYKGRMAEVEAYADCDEVEILVNGEPAAKGKSDQMVFRASVPYRRGEITAVAYRDSRKAADGMDLCYVAVTVDFAAAACAFKYTVEGDFPAASEAEILALAGGDGSGSVQR